MRSDTSDDSARPWSIVRESRSHVARSLAERLLPDSITVAIDMVPIGSMFLTTEPIPALDAAAKHPEMAEDLAEVLSTLIVELEYRVESRLPIER
jgi:hypothetical protein